MRARKILIHDILTRWHFQKRQFVTLANSRWFTFHARWAGKRAQSVVRSKEVQAEALKSWKKLQPKDCVSCGLAASPTCTAGLLPGLTAKFVESFILTRSLSLSLTEESRRKCAKDFFSSSSSVVTVSNSEETWTHLCLWKESSSPFRASLSNCRWKSGRKSYLSGLLSPIYLFFSPPLAAFDTRRLSRLSSTK